MLWQHRSPMLGTDAHTTYAQHCLNVVSTLVLYVESSVATTFTQRCINVVSMLVSNVESDVATRFTHGCLNIVSILFSNVGEQHRHNFHTTLPERCLNIGQCRPMFRQHCGNVGILVKIQHWYNIHTTLSGRPHNVAGMSKYVHLNVAAMLELMLRQCWHQCCDNVAITLEC